MIIEAVIRHFNDHAIPFLKWNIQSLAKYPTINFTIIGGNNMDISMVMKSVTFAKAPGPYINLNSTCI